MRLLSDLTRAEPEPLLKGRVTPLEFLEAVYHDETQPLSVRLRAAIEAAPFRHAKFSASLAMSDAAGLRGATGARAEAQRNGAFADGH